MIIDRNIWNTLLTVMAKHDVRYYLNGINVDVEHNRLSATDGHRLFVKNIEFPVEYLDFSSRIMMLDNTFKAPKSIDYISIDVSKFDLNEPVKIDYFTKSDVMVLSRYCNLSDAKFPDIDKVLPKESDCRVKESNISINPEYITDVIKSLCTDAMKINIYPDKKYSFDFIDRTDRFEGVQYVVMGMRL